MKKLLCFLLTLMLLLSFAGCGGKSEKAQIEELLSCKEQTEWCLATKEEYRACYSEEFWSWRTEDVSFEELYEKSMARKNETAGENSSASQAIAQSMLANPEAYFGKNFTISVELKKKEKLDKDKLESTENSILKLQKYSVELEKGYEVTYVVKLKGDKETYESDEKNYLVYLIDGHWRLQ